MTTARNVTDIFLSVFGYNDTRDFKVAKSEDESWLVYLRNNQFIVTLLSMLVLFFLFYGVYLISPKLYNEADNFLKLVVFVVIFLFLFTATILIFYSFLELLFFSLMGVEEEDKKTFYQEFFDFKIFQNRKRGFLSYFGIEIDLIGSEEQRQKELNFLESLSEFERKAKFFTPYTLRHIGEGFDRYKIHNYSSSYAKKLFNSTLDYTLIKMGCYLKECGNVDLKTVV